MRRIWMVVLAVTFAVAGGMWAGCGDDETGTGVHEDCPGDECVSCDDHSECAEEGTYCDADEGVCLQIECEADDECGDDSLRCSSDGWCIPDVCEPGDSRCDDDGESVIYCDEVGSGWLDPIECPSGQCDQGVCGCDNEDQCRNAEQCEDGGCQCPTEICGDDGTCCEDGEVCTDVEVCDEDGDCETFRDCRPECEGEFCGFQGELCCEGDEPVCGPHGECVQECEGDLCGEEFDICCDAGEICIFGDCVEPGDDCEHFTDCGFDEYCDEGIGKCLPDDFPEDLVCEDEYDFDEVQPEIMWQWDGVEVGDTLYKNVMMTPLVADMDGDGTPNVIFNAYPDDNNVSIPVVADGATGDTVYYNDHHGTDFGSQLSAADITGDGLPEIVAVEHGSEGIGVMENIVDCPDPDDDDDGCYLWWNDDDVDSHQPAPVVADLNADGNIEIIMGDAVLEGTTGDLLGRLDSGGYGYTTAVDVTGDGTLEVLGAGCLYSLTGDQEIEEEWCADSAIAPDGRRFVAAGDVTDDGDPEFIITGDGNVYVVAGTDGEVLYELPIYGGGDGGSPIVADFDGDGSAEFGIASAECYTVYDLDCINPDAEDDDELMDDQPGCERPEIETCDYGHHCACHELRDTKGTGDGVLWSIYVQDESSHRTGSSVFDFQGDGRSEVVYNDECLLMVLDGQTGEPYFIYGNTNRTSSEYPIVADVTGDNQTNIVVSANNDEFARDCETPINTRPERFAWCHPEDEDEEVDEFCDEGTHGVIALQDPEDRWVRTRSIWNQFDYFIDNADDDAGVPTSPDMPWESHNTFRANQQGEIPLNAPDVVVSSVQVDPFQCPMDIYFQATIQNAGMAAIPEGMPVSLYVYESGDGTGQLVETIVLDESIPPGGMIQVPFVYEIEMGQLNNELDFEIRANDDGTDEQPVRDCNPDDASMFVEEVLCTMPG